MERLLGDARGNLCNLSLIEFGASARSSGEEVEEDSFDESGASAGSLSTETEQVKEQGRQQVLTGSLHQLQRRLCRELVPPPSNRVV